MITNEMLLLVAKYDGWEIVGIPFFNPPYKILAKQTPSIIKEIPYISPSGKEYDDWAKEMKYLTSMDWLHPVALKVLDKLKEISDNDSALYMRSAIRSHCSTRPDNGQYIDLFNAVYEGIIFINQNK